MEPSYGHFRDRYCDNCHISPLEVAATKPQTQNPKPQTPSSKPLTPSPKRCCSRCLIRRRQQAQRAMVSSATIPPDPQAPAPAAPGSSPGAKNALESQISAEERRKLQESIMGFTAQVTPAPAEFEVDISDLLALTRYSSSSSRELDTAI